MRKQSGGARRGNEQNSVLLRWIDRVAYLVPFGLRPQWREEWHAELQYLFSQRKRPGLKRSMGVGLGALRDATHIRLHRTSRDGGKMKRVIQATWSDIRLGLLFMAREPGFSFSVVGTLALGIGATVTVFTVINALLINPLPFPESDRLALLWLARPGANVDRDWLSGGHFADIVSGTRTIELASVAAGFSATLSGEQSPTRVSVLEAPSSLTGLLGLRTSQGRTVQLADDEAGAARVVVVTSSFWVNELGSDPNIVGSSLSLDGEPYEVVGVLAPDVLLSKEVIPTMDGEGDPDLIMSLPLTDWVRTDRTSEFYNVIVRLADGVSIATAQAELDVVSAAIRRDHEADPESGFTIYAVPMISEVVGAVRPSLLVLMAAVFGLLLIACLNVANLFMSKLPLRRQELAVRVALGAGRWRIARQLFLESSTFAVAGGLAGWMLAVIGVALARVSGAGSLPRMGEIKADATVVLFVVGITALTALSFGSIPALLESRVDLGTIMRMGARGSVGRRPSVGGLSKGLAVIQLAMSLTLLVGGGLLVRSVLAQLHVDPGFAIESRNVFAIHLAGPTYRSRDSRVAFHDALKAELSATPWVDAVGIISDPPLAETVSWAPISVDGYALPQGSNHQIISDFRVADGEYFSVMSVPLTSGRLFDSRDQAGSEGVILIDERFSETYFPDANPLGRRVSFWGAQGVEIVGVVKSVNQYAMGEVNERVAVYQPLSQAPQRTMYYIVETVNERSAALPQLVREAVRALDPEVAAVGFTTMEDLVDDSLAPQRFAAGLLELLGVMSLTIALVGVFGVVSSLVNSSRRELGLRVALGESTRSVLGRVMRKGANIAVAGTLLGFFGALAMSNAIQSLLFGVHPLDFFTFASVSGILVCGSLFACYLPARRASRTDPAAILKGDG